MGQKYLQTIYQLTNKGNKKAKTSEIAEELEISNPSVTEQIKKLEREDLVCRAPYKGFTLSPMGKQKAEKLLEKQKTVQKFLENYLEVEKSEEQAQKITPDLTQETIQKMKSKLSDEVK